jgi:type VI secretion system protein VasJ
LADLNELAKLGLQSIPGDSPVGASIEFDPSYEALRTEIQKLDSVSKDPVDWRMIIETSSDILGNRSKHLVVAAYLTLALFEEHDYPGLACGLTVLRDLVANFWDTMEPPARRKRGRIETFTWLAERSGKPAADLKPDRADKEALDTCAQCIKDLSAKLTEKLGDSAPGFGDLHRSVDKHVADLAAAAKAAEAAEAAKKAQAAKIASGEIDELSAPEDAKKILKKIQASAKQICDFWRKQDSKDPAPYRLIRSLTWDPLKDVPPNTNGLTQIPAPPPDQTARLNEMQQKADWANLVQAAESAFPGFALWLDLQRWSAQGLMAMGATHAAAADAVMAELAGFLRRLPNLPDLKFAGGMIPLASNDTKVWLSNELKRFAAGGDDTGSSRGTGDNVPTGLAEAAEDARRLVAGGKLGAALKLFQDGMASAGEKRAHFLWRLEMARLCVDAGRAGVAIAHLEVLESEIERHGLEDWEPELCLQAYMALLSARRILLKDPRRATPDLAQKTTQVHERLCRLNAAAALALDGK